MRTSDTPSRGSRREEVHRVPVQAVPEDPEVPAALSEAHARVHRGDAALEAAGRAAAGAGGAEAAAEAPAPRRARAGHGGWAVRRADPAEPPDPPRRGEG